MSDAYSPEPRSYQRKGGTRTMSESTSYTGKGENELQSTLNRLGVSFQVSGIVAAWVELRQILDAEIGNATKGATR